MEGKLTFFGTGAATGVPVIGCQCAICLSASPLNKRKRSCSLLEIGSKKFLIDVGPDFRSQALEYHVNHLDGLILTHTHYDHIAGIDDLRIFSFKHKKPFPVLVSQETMQAIRRQYYYLLEESTPKLMFQILEEEIGETEFLGLKMRYFFHDQLGMQVTGYRFGNLSFVTDIKHYSEDLFDVIKGSDILILSAIDWKKTRAHISIDEAIEIGEKAQVKKVILTHVGHELDHEQTSEKLPKFMELAYDGLSIPCRL
jgi:phosphoribosyl 1,2-cyclic phosphate phosphodiesterase